MNKRKILIGVPLKGGVSATFLKGFIEIIRRSDPTLDLDHCFHSGSSVNFARNECCHYALKIKAREVVFIDEDMGFEYKHWIRLLSHVDLDIVAGLYCKKLPGQATWLTNLMEGKDPDENGLCEVEEIGTGFMKIRVDTVLKKMVTEYPEREYVVKQDGPNGTEYSTSQEFFPMGVMGARSHGARLERVKMAVKNWDPTAIPLGMSLENWMQEYAKVFVKITNACYDEQPPGNLFGEDYYFCRQARACGFKIYADFGMPIVPHHGMTSYPITPEMAGLDPTALLARAAEKAGLPL